jgi:hypothetical protein
VGYFYKYHWLGSLCRKVLKFKHFCIKMQLIALALIINYGGCSGYKFMLHILLIFISNKNSLDLILLLSR